MTGQDLLRSQFLAIEPTYVDFVRGILERRETARLMEEELDFEAISRSTGKPLENAQKATVQDGVALIPVRGAIFPHATLMSRVSDTTTADRIAQDISASVSDRDVHSIAMLFDTPGGNVTGIAELASYVKSVRGVKPIAAHVCGSCCSAGYWIASACDSIYVEPTARVGSIGAMFQTIDDSEKMKRDGYKNIRITSSRAPEKALDPATPEGQAAIQSYVDAIEDVFIGDVASNRGVSVDTVLSEFGQGGVFVGAEAVRRGMVDGIMTQDDLVYSLVAANRARKGLFN